MTAVEYFETELKDKLGTIVINKNWELLEQIIEQAKQMEKEQIIKCYIDVSVESCKTLNFQVTLKDRIDFKNIAEIYYNETFKST